MIPEPPPEEPCSRCGGKWDVAELAACPSCGLTISDVAERVAEQLAGRPDEFDELVTHVRELGEQLQELVDDPTVLDGMTPVQMAWLREQLELLREESEKLRRSVEQHLKERS